MPPRDSLPWAVSLTDRQELILRTLLTRPLSYIAEPSNGLYGLARAKRPPNLTRTSEAKAEGTCDAVGTIITPRELTVVSNSLSRSVVSIGQKRLH
jgi:hypothetical protein